MSEHKHSYRDERCVVCLAARPRRVSVGDRVKIREASTVFIDDPAVSLAELGLSPGMVLGLLDALDAAEAAAREAKRCERSAWAEYRSLAKAWNARYAESL